MYTLKQVGSACKQWRIEIGYTQRQVADDTGYCAANISQFESGKNDNLTIFIWYMRHGLTIEYLRGFIDG